MVCAALSGRQGRRGVQRDAGTSGKRFDAHCRPDGAALRVAPRRPPAVSRASTVFPDTLFGPLLADRTPGRNAGRDFGEKCGLARSVAAAASGTGRRRRLEIPRYPRVARFTLRGPPASRGPPSADPRDTLFRARDPSGAGDIFRAPEPSGPRDIFRARKLSGPRDIFRARKLSGPRDIFRARKLSGPRDIFRARKLSGPRDPGPWCGVVYN